MGLWIDVAIFIVGAIAWDLFSHSGFLVYKQEPRFGPLHFTNKLNKIIVTADFIALLLLVYVAWFSGLNI